jgi:hypothetical protein
MPSHKRGDYVYIGDDPIHVMKDRAAYEELRETWI